MAARGRREADHPDQFHERALPNDERRPRFHPRPPQIHQRRHLFHERRWPSHPRPGRIDRRPGQINERRPQINERSLQNDERRPRFHERNPQNHQQYGPFHPRPPQIHQRRHPADEQRGFSPELPQKSDNTPHFGLRRGEQVGEPASGDVRDEQPEDGKGKHGFEKAGNRLRRASAKSGRDCGNRSVCHICSTTSMPRVSSPCFKTRAVKSHNASRLARVASSAFSTGQFS